jgi:hypothetical protein
LGAEKRWGFGRQFSLAKTFRKKRFKKLGLLLVLSEK